jgi:hypothetical protein
LLRDPDREVGWRWGARDLAGSKVIKRRRNELRRGGTWRCGGVEPGMRWGVAGNGRGGGAFYSAEEAAEGRGGGLSSGGRWWFIKVSVME